MIQKITKGWRVLEEDVSLEAGKAAGYGDGYQEFW